MSDKEGQHQRMKEVIEQVTNELFDMVAKGEMTQSFDTMAKRVVEAKCYDKLYGLPEGMTSQSKMLKPGSSHRRAEEWEEDQEQDLAEISPALEIEMKEVIEKVSFGLVELVMINHSEKEENEAVEKMVKKVVETLESRKFSKKDKEQWKWLAELFKQKLREGKVERDKRDKGLHPHA